MIYTRMAEIFPFDQQIFVAIQSHRYPATGLSIHAIVILSTVGACSDLLIFCMILQLADTEDIPTQVTT